MVDPYDFIGSPTVKRTRRKSMRKTSKKRKSKEKSRRVSIRQANVRTRSNTRDKDHRIDIYEKENNPDNGFTQLIQTKMMEVKKRQGKHTNKKAKIIIDDNHSPLVSRKRQRSSRC
jgi:hypothetical protein